MRVSRADALEAARAFVKGQGDDPARYVTVAESGSALPSLEDAGETGAGLIPYRWERNAERWLLGHGGMPALRTWATTVLPGPVWQVRFARERDRHRWWVVVDARDGRVTGFSRGFPEEEAGASSLRRKRSRRRAERRGAGASTRRRSSRWCPRTRRSERPAATTGSSSRCRRRPRARPGSA
ncbi:MAG: hypothetical protein IPF66_13540 [Holophagales bacterium]|nr:hypothetical protein [Holophagales bacterium]